MGRTVGFNNPSMEYWGKAKVMEAQLANRVSLLKRNMLQGNMNAKDTLCGEFSVGFGGLDILLPHPVHGSRQSTSDALQGLLEDHLDKKTSLF